LSNWSTRRWLLVVLIVAILVRLGLWSIYPLTQNNDSPTYIQLGKSLLNSGFANYNATRSPGYPAFLALVGGWTYFAQICLGLLTTLLFFYMGWKLSHRAWFAALAALLHTLNLGQLFFEATLLTETLTTFLVTFALAGAFFVWQQEGTRWRLAGALVAGLSAALAGITRPLFVFLPFLLALFLFLVEPKFTRRWPLALLGFLPALLIFGGWLNFVDTHFKILSFDTIGGYRWLNHTGEYFEYVPDKYADIRSTYIYYRDRKIAETGTQTNAVWDALPEMQEASRLGYFGLSRLLTDISMDLIRTHPDLYLKNVLSGWWMFWWAAVYWSAQALKTSALVPVLDGLISIERGVLILGNFLFLAGSLLAVFLKKIREQLGVNPLLWFGIASVWSASVLQTLLDHGDNPRYLVPMQSLAVLITLYWLSQIWNYRNETR
jgi:4-amino-4-deoxy-L-arabinose transferase-like glycosyltransferase